MMKPDRRRFLIGCMNACAIAAVGISGADAALRAPRAQGILYDARFASSLEIARRLHGEARLLPVPGHVGALEPAFLERLAYADRFVLSGVTTEVVPFCLQQLVRPPRVADLTIGRIDRDLFTWSLRVSSRGSAPEPASA